MHKVTNSAPRPGQASLQPAGQPYAYSAQPQQPRRPSSPAALPKAGLMHRLWRVCHPQQARRNAMTLMQELEKPATRFAGRELAVMGAAIQAGRSVSQFNTVHQALAEFRWTAARANDAKLAMLLGQLKPVALSRLVEDLLDRDDPLSRRVSGLLDGLTNLQVAKYIVLERRLNAVLTELPQAAGLALAVLDLGHLVEHMAMPQRAVVDVCAQVVGQLPDASWQALAGALNTPTLADAQLSLGKAGRGGAEHFFTALAVAAEKDKAVSPECGKLFREHIAGSCKKTQQQTTWLPLATGDGVVVGVPFAKAARQCFDFRLDRSTALVDYKNWPADTAEQNQRIAQGGKRLSDYFAQQGGAQTACILMAHTDDVIKALLASLDDQGQSLLRNLEGDMHWELGVTPSIDFRLDQGRVVMELTMRQELADGTAKMLSATVGLGDSADAALQMIAPPAVRILAH